MWSGGGRAINPVRKICYVAGYSCAVVKTSRKYSQCANAISTCGRLLYSIGIHPWNFLWKTKPKGEMVCFGNQDRSG